MEKRVVRNKCILGIQVNILRTLEDGQTLRELEMAKGKDYILRKSLYDNDCSYIELREQYAEFMENGYSDYFSWMYPIREGFGVIIDSHIYVCRYDTEVDEEIRAIFGWGYLEGRHFLGDVWWFEDKEILDDIQHMNIVDFLSKYRGI